MAKKAEQIREMLAANFSYEKIAAKTGASKGTISFHAKKLGLGKWKLNRPTRRYDWDAVQRHHDTGQNRKQCVEKFGMSQAAWDGAVRNGHLVVRPIAKKPRQTARYASLWQINDEDIRRIARYVQHDGYVMLHITSKAGKTARTLEHRFLMERQLNRTLGKREVVHHKDGNRSNNELSNLEVLSSTDHAKHHGGDRASKTPRIDIVCRTCGATIRRTENRLQHNVLRGADNYCSKKCAGIAGRRLLTDSLHGTLSGYIKCGPIKCDACRQVMKIYSKKRRTKAKLLKLRDATAG